MPLLSANDLLYTGAGLPGPTVDQPTFDPLAIAANPRSFLSSQISEMGVLPDPGSNVYNLSGEPFNAEKFSDDYAKAMCGFMGLSERWTTAISANIFGIPNVDAAFRVQRSTLLQTLSNSPVEEFARFFYNLPILDQQAIGTNIPSFIGALAGNSSSIQTAVVTAFRTFEGLGDMLAPIMNSMQTATEHLQNIPIVGWVIGAVKTTYQLFRGYKSYKDQKKKEAYEGRPWTKRVVYNQIEDTVRAQRILASYMKGDLDFFGAFDYDEVLNTHCERWMGLPGNPSYSSQGVPVLPPFCNDRAYWAYTTNQAGGGGDPIYQVAPPEAAADKTLPIEPNGNTQLGGAWSNTDIRNSKSGTTYGKRARLVGDREWATPEQLEMFGSLRDPLHTKWKDGVWSTDARITTNGGSPTNWSQIFKFRQSYAPGTSTGLTDFELFKDGHFNVVSQVLNPASCALVLRLWGETIRMTPTMYCLDAKTEAVRWRELQISVIDRIYYYANTKSYNTAANALFQKLKQSLNWDGLSMSDYEPGKVSKVRDVLENSVPVKALKNLASRQMKCLDLGILPYLSSDMPAIARNPDMKNKLEVNRGIFLQHPAICYADPSAIPHHRSSGLEQFAYHSDDDNSFYNVVEWTHAGTNFGHPYNGKCFTAQNPQYALKQPKFDLDTSTPLDPPILEATVDFSRLTSPSSGGGGAALAVGGVAAAAAAFAFIGKK